MKRIIAITSVLCIVLSFTACGGTVSQINREDITEVTIDYLGRSNGSFTLNDDEIDRFIELFNQSQIGDINEGHSTPYYVCKIKIKNWKNISIYECSELGYQLYYRTSYNSSLLNEILDKPMRYIENDELVIYIEDLIAAKLSIDLDTDNDWIL